jgi:hypothetical protein
MTFPFDGSKELMRKWFEAFIKESQELSKTHQDRNLVASAVKLAGEQAHHPCGSSPGQHAPVHILNVSMWSRIKFEPILAYGHMGDAIPLWMHYYRFLKDCAHVLEEVKTDG